MKILQIETFYDRYVVDFYGQNRNLFGASYEEHVRALLEDGFSASHMMAPHMGNLGYEAMLVIANCGPAQAQWARENGLPEPRSFEDFMGVVARQIETFRPDVLYLTDSILFDDRFVRSLAWQPRLVIGWRAASIPARTDWTGFDLILSSDEVFRRRALEQGARAVEFFRPGFPGFLAKAVEGQPKEWDLVFSGQISPEHTHRLACLSGLGKAVDGGMPASLGFFLSGAEPDRLPEEVRRYARGSVWGSRMYRTLRSGRIVLNTHIDLVSNPAQNMRLFEATGSGSFLLTEASDGLPALFEPGREVETYRDLGELLEKVRHYLDHSEEREAIAKRGQERCLREHSVEVRVRVLDEMIRRHLAQGRPTDDAPRLLALATDHFNHGRLTEAATVLEGILGRNAAHPEALHLLGLVLHRAGHNGQAAEFIRRAAALTPSSWIFRGNLGVVLRSLGQNDEAEQAYRDALALNPCYPEAAYNLANLLRLRGAAAEAESLCRDILAREPGAVVARHALAELLLAEGRAAEAIAEFRTILEHAPSHQAAQDRLAELAKRTTET